MISFWFAVALAALEWKTAALRTLVFWLSLVLERASAPKIDVPAPIVQIDSAPAAEPLTPWSAGPDKIQCYEKATNRPIGFVQPLTPAQVKEVVARARVAQRSWANTSFRERRRVLFALLNYVVDNHRVLCETCAVECGKTLLDGTFGEILTTCEKLMWTILHGEDALAEESRSVGLITLHKKALLRYVPFGVISAIVSWNYPLHNIIGPMISALFAGNAFVGKVSEYSSFYATTYYEKIVQDALVKCGHSPDLVRFIAGFPDAGAALIEASDKLTFIGSPAVGKKVMEKASQTLTPVVLELGGKDPAIVCDDADLDRVMPILMRGTFQNCGQNCVGLERVVAQESIHDRIVERAAAQLRRMSQGATRVGPGGDDAVHCMGAMTMGPRECARIQALVDESVRAGARLVTGGDWTPAKGTFYPPTIIVDVRPGMAVAEHEVFGPIMAVMKFTTDDQAVEMVNSCPYGLGSNVFSDNAERALRIGRRLQTGMCNINDFAINYLCQSLPFGGVKISGFDRFAGVEGLRGCCVLRAETQDRFPGVRTHVPPALDYPLTKWSQRFSESLVRVLYGSVFRMVPAVLQLLSVEASAKAETASAAPAAAATASARSASADRKTQ
jgi:acyl-CoA reductase-like NAD-dependent aldehyde dehydrogenase